MQTVGKQDAIPKPIDLEALEVNQVDDYFYPPKEVFLIRNDAGRWLPLRAGSYKRLLKVERALFTSQETDLETVRVQMQNDVSMYGPLCGRNAGFYEDNGTRILVTHDMNLIEPRKGTAPTIIAVLKGLLVESETTEIGADQLHTFCGWLKSSVEALRAGRYQQQQAIAICGVHDCGKSMIQHHIITPCLAGRSADAMRYFLKDNDFNANLFGAEHLFLDDCRSQSRIGTRLAFGEKIKTHTVGATVKSLHGKGRDEISVRPWWRISITVNDNPESLMVLPPLNEDFADKLILLRASRFDFPVPNSTNEEKVAFDRKLKSEIPAFLYWLLNEYQLPDQYVDPRRYNVATFHHPELKTNLESLSPESELLELIDLTLGNDKPDGDGAVWITAEKLEERIRNVHQRRAEQIFTYRQSCAKYLHRLSVKQPDRVKKARTNAGNGWNIFRPKSSVEGVEGDFYSE